MGNNGILNLLNGKLHGRRYVGRPWLRWEDVRIGFLLLLDLKEWTRHRVGATGVELLKIPGSDTDCRATEEEEDFNSC